MFDSLTRFTVLIERRATPFIWVLSLLLLLTSAMFGAPRATAQTGRQAQAEKRLHKMSPDLKAGLDSAQTPKQRWARDKSGRREVQVIFTVGDADADMSDLKRDIKRAGGTIDASMPSLRMLTATLPAQRVAKIAERNDVVHVAPNRPTQRTASVLEKSTGAVTSPVRTSSTKTSYSGPDGTGIGIAIVDSGVMKNHRAFDNGSAVTRVKKNVQFLTTNLADWTNGYDMNTSLQPGSAALVSYEAAIDNSTAIVQDGYGHGTHVASIAAGRPKSYATAPDLTGMAPNADIYDVKVLNDYGFGTLSDTLEGIQWVIYHAKEYNIRVMNISLAMDSTDSWQYDPLCVAARSAVAQGITVVVAAGNFGKSLFGSEVYGSVSSPGNDPSVITVGSANTKNTAVHG